MSEKPNKINKEGNIAESSKKAVTKKSTMKKSTAAKKKSSVRTSKTKIKTEVKSDLSEKKSINKNGLKKEDDLNNNIKIEKEIKGTEVIDNNINKTVENKKSSTITTASKSTKTGVKKSVRKAAPKTEATANKTSKNTSKKVEKTSKDLTDIKTQKAVSEELTDVKSPKKVEALRIKQTKGKSENIVVKHKTQDNIDKSEITNFNKYLFHQGRNYESYNILGSHVRVIDGKEGVQFATWAPNASEVFITGDFNNFEVKDEYKLKRISECGLWYGFFENTKVGQKYKYYIIGPDNHSGEYKADPYAIQSELRPGSASIIYKPEQFKWNDKKWMEKRNSLNVLEQPLNIYEMHLGSWKTNDDGSFLTYEEISEKLPKYITEMGYTHVEIMPLIEHPLDASWGYQGTGYYSPTSRYGKLEGLKLLVDKLHEANIGVIMDWVPGHFCKDSHGLYKFDGTPTYEYQEEWRAENKGWGTCNFDLGRPEVKSYLISNALYWFREFHIDGLRVDAVSSILYLDYSRQPGEWKPNKYGGNGSLEAIDFLKELNQAVFEEYPTALMIAEESTAWPNVTKPPIDDGLGFNFKWNMGWMNDTLEYIKIDPEYRPYNHRNITFAMMYNYAENYLLPLSHDEVVHGKKSLVEKMWGDKWNKFAGLRAFIGYMMGHPGKKLTFMGCEFAQHIEWREYESLQWNIIDESEDNKKTQLFFKDINKLYLENKAFWELDHDPKGFNWIEADNNQQSILIFARRSRDDKDTLVFIINFKPIVYYDYQIGVPFLGDYEELLNTDDSKYGGSGQIMGTTLVAEKEPFHNQPYSLKIKVPPMATLILKVKNIKVEEKELKIDKQIDKGSNLENITEK